MPLRRAPRVTESLSRGPSPGVGGGAHPPILTPPHPGRPRSPPLASGARISAGTRVRAGRAAPPARGAGGTGQGGGGERSGGGDRPRRPLPLLPHPPRAPPRRRGRLRSAAPAAAGPAPPPPGRTLAPAQCHVPGCGSHAEPVRRGVGGSGSAPAARRPGPRDAAALGRAGTLEAGLGPALPSAPVRPPEPSETGPQEGRRGRRARDPRQPIRALLTCPRGPDAFPTPTLAPEGRGGGLRPLPHTASVSGVGGDTPDYIFPHTKPRGHWIPPGRFQDPDSSLRGLPVENHPPAASCGHTLPARLATPTRPHRSCGSGLWRSYEWPDLPQLGGRRSPRARRPGKTVGKGGGERVLPPADVLPLESPTLGAANWLSDMAAAASLRGSAALFCLVTDALGIKFMT